MNCCGINMDAACVRCLLNKHLDAARDYGTAEQVDAFCLELLKLVQASLNIHNSAWVDAQITKLYEIHFRKPRKDMAEEKEISNRFVLERMEEIRRVIQAQPDPVLAGLQFSILGNYLDFAALGGQVSFEKLDTMLADALDMQLDGQMYARFMQELAQGKRLLYVVDNAGEIGFDRLFAEQLQSRFPHLQITFCVRGLPVQNDATREDAAYMGISFPLVDTGNAIGGVELSQVSRECLAAMEQSDVILAKGMGNLETMYGCGYNVYYAFLCKCVRIIEFFQKEKLTPMFVGERQ